MDWFILAAIPPFFWALTSIADQYMARQFFAHQSFSQLSFSTLAFVVILFGIFIFNPRVLEVTNQTAFGLMGLGVLFYISVIPYLFAIQKEEANNALPLFQTIPFFTAFIGWVFLKEVLEAKDIFAGLVIIAGGMGMLWDFEKRIFSLRSFGWIMLSSFIVSVYMILLRQFSITDLDWLTITFWTLCGRLLISSMSFICSTPIRQNIFNVLKDNPIKAPAIDVIQHVLSFSAVSFTVIAMASAPNATFVMLINALHPLILLILTTILSFFLPHVFKSKIKKRYFAVKIIFLGMIFSGLVLLITT